MKKLFLSLVFLSLPFITNCRSSIPSGQEQQTLLAVSPGNTALILRKMTNGDYDLIRVSMDTGNFFRVIAQLPATTSIKQLDADHLLATGPSNVYKLILSTASVETALDIGAIDIDIDANGNWWLLRSLPNESSEKTEIWKHDIQTGESLKIADVSPDPEVKAKKMTVSPHASTAYILYTPAFKLNDAYVIKIDLQNKTQEQLVVSAQQPHPNSKISFAAPIALGWTHNGLYGIVSKTAVGFPFTADAWELIQVTSAQEQKLILSDVGFVSLFAITGDASKAIMIDARTIYDNSKVTIDILELETGQTNKIQSSIIGDGKTRNYNTLLSCLIE